MRRKPSFAFRALLSGAAVLLLALFSMIPSGHERVTEARPVLQEDTPTATDIPTATPLPPDPQISGTLEETITAGTSGTYSLNVTNNGDISDRFTFSIVTTDSTIPGLSYSVSPASAVITPGNSRNIDVIVTSSSSSPAGVDRRFFRVVASSNPNITVQALLETTVNAAPTITPTDTVVPSPTRTTVPTATAGPICRDDIEPNDDIGSAKELRPDQPQTRVLCPFGDQDWYFFGSTAGKVISVDITAMTAGLDMSLGIYDGNGNLLAFNDDFPRGNDPVANIRPRIQSYRVPADGRYFIRAADTGQRGDTDLSYTIALISESFGPTPTLVPELCTDLFEPDGVPEQARLMVIREVQPGHRMCPSGDADWVRFFAKSGARYALRVDSQQRVGADPVMVLVDRDGASILDFSDDTNGTFDPRIEFTPVVDGFFFAQVKNVGDIGNQFILYDLFFEPLSVAGGTPLPTGGPQEPTPTDDAGLLPTPTDDPAFPTDDAATPTDDPTFPTDDPTFPTDEPTPTDDPFADATPDEVGRTATALCQEYPGDEFFCPTNNSFGRLKGQPAFINGPYKEFVDPAFKNVWSRTDQVVATRKANRTWMWGPGGLVGRAEIYTQSPGGVRQVQYFDKSRMEISNWGRDRANPWFVTNGLLVREMIEGRMQIGDAQFSQRPVAQIGIAGDANDGQAPTYASLRGLLPRTTNRQGQDWGKLVRRDGKIADYEKRPESRLAYYVPETGHHVAQVFWDFLQSKGPIGDGSREDVLIDWVFAMGYPITEPYWTKVKVGGVERDVLVQAFQRRVLTYTPTNPTEWRIEMGNVGRHYYQWRYGKQP